MEVFSVPPAASEDTDPLSPNRASQGYHTEAYRLQLSSERETSSFTRTPSPSENRSTGDQLLLLPFFAYPSSVKRTFKVWESTYRGAFGAGQTRMAVSSGRACSPWHAGLAWEAWVSFVTLESNIEVNLARLALGSWLAHQPWHTLWSLREQSLVRPPPKTPNHRANQQQGNQDATLKSGDGFRAPCSLCRSKKSQQLCDRALS